MNETDQMHVDRAIEALERQTTTYLPSWEGGAAVEGLGALKMLKSMCRAAADEIDQHWEAH